MPGMLRSIRTTSGPSAGDDPDRLGAVGRPRRRPRCRPPGPAPTAALHGRPGGRRRRPPGSGHPWRTSSPTDGRGNTARTTVPAGPERHLAAAAELLGTLAHRRQPDTFVERRSNPRPRSATSRHSSSRVQLIRSRRGAHAGVGGDVRQRLLPDPVRRHLDRRRQVEVRGRRDAPARCRGSRRAAAAPRRVRAGPAPSAAARAPPGAASPSASRAASSSRRSSASSTEPGGCRPRSDPSCIADRGQRRAEAVVQVAAEPPPFLLPRLHQPLPAQPQRLGQPDRADRHPAVPAHRGEEGAVVGGPAAGRVTGHHHGSDLLGAREQGHRSARPPGPASARASPVRPAPRPGRRAPAATSPPTAATSVSASSDRRSRDGWIRRAG